ncbi:MSHA biogenesis protein MshK [uncultured Photobacterium sp.]|uniref:MSHA biogenesis protein MshK n=1 Tax=uncultured Photobacterium sp. TaxID=173973 RepID=UPI00260B2F3A|nr:MSHA biogenesis protein MshK [uncultured Photobacterium sp.]
MVKNITLIILLVIGFIVQSAFAAQDPTAPLGWINNNSKVRIIPRAPLPALQSIICDERHCSVILNGTVVGLGGSIQGYKLIRVTDNTVTLSRGGKKWQLALFAENIRIN